MQHWLVKEYAKLVGNHLQIWSGSFTGRGGGGGLGLLKLQLQVLKKRRVLRLSNGPNGLEKLHGGAKLPPQYFWQPGFEKRFLPFF